MPAGCLSSSVVLSSALSLCLGCPTMHPSFSTEGAHLNITPNLNNLARVIYGLAGLALIVWAALGGFRTVVTVGLIAFGVVLIAEGGAGW